MAQALRVRLRTPSPAGRAGRGRGEAGGGRALALASGLLHRPDKPAGVGSPAIVATLVFLGSVRLLIHWARRAASRADCTAGSTSPISTLIITITTSSSISVKAPQHRGRYVVRFMAQSSRK